MNFQPELPLKNERVEPLFKLDGRTVSFPEGLQTAHLTHTLHRFPGKFVPQVARELIDLTGIGQNEGLIADPFCGSGTTLVEAATAGIASVGTDFDPLGALIARVKTTPLLPDELRELADYWRVSIPEDSSPAHAPQVNNLEHWFTSAAVGQLSFIKGHCAALPDRLRDFSLVVMSSVIRRVSNADDQTQKTYVSGTLPKVPPLPRDLFPLFLSRAIAGMRDFQRECQVVPLVVNGDARLTVGRARVDGIATSPPYLDSIDYVYNQMLEYFWLHDHLGMSGPDDIRALRSKPLGFARSSLDSIFEELSAHTPAMADLLKKDIDAIALISRKEAEHVAGYFRDFGKHLDVCRSALPSGGRYAMSVGESLVRGRQIATPDLLVHMFTSYGFDLVGRCSYDIKRHYMKFPRRSNSGKIKLDHILCFEAA